MVARSNFRTKMTRSEAFKALDETTQGFLKELASTFGKPTAICIRFENGNRYDGGTFMAAQDYPDFRKRCEQQPSS